MGFKKAKKQFGDADASRRKRFWDVNKSLAKETIEAKTEGRRRICKIIAR